jgi:hypothetical protein
MLGGTLPSATERELAAEYQKAREAPARSIQISAPVHESIYSISESDLFAGNPQKARHGPQLALLAEVEKQRAVSANAAVAARMLTVSNEGKERTGRDAKFRDGMGGRDAYRDVVPEPIISAARAPRGAEAGLAPSRDPLCMLTVQVTTPDIPRQEIDPERPAQDAHFGRTIRAVANGAIVPPSFMDHPTAATPAQIAAALGSPAPQDDLTVGSRPAIATRPNLASGSENAGAALPDSVLRLWGFAPAGGAGAGAGAGGAGAGGAGAGAGGADAGLSAGDPLSQPNSELFSNAFCRAATACDKLVLLCSRAWRIVEFGAFNVDSTSGAIAYAAIIAIGAALVLLVFSAVHSLTGVPARSRRRV